MAALFLQQPDAPRSIFHNLRQIHAALLAIQTELPAPDPATLAAVETLLDFLKALPLETYFGATPTMQPVRSLEKILSELLERLGALHALLSDHYFSRQARLPAIDAQGELGLL
jgi:uncharacterized alpha-E superfamily protein